MLYQMLLHFSCYSYQILLCLCPYHNMKPTLQRICDDFNKVFDGGATSESIRDDLWNNANISIRSDEFNDVFDHRQEG